MNSGSLFYKKLYGGEITILEAIKLFLWLHFTRTGWRHKHKSGFWR
jgi:hypothetical protein